MRTSNSIPLAGFGAPTKRGCRKAVLRIAVVVGTIAISLHFSGIVHAYSVHGGSMIPALCLGDQFLMERLTFLLRKPERDDIVVLKTDGIASLPLGGIYIKRIVGEPGERVYLADGRLYVNGTPMSLRNQAGEIRYLPVGGQRHLISSEDIVVVPEGHYFVLGDNSADSADSRVWGCVPAKNIIGRVAFRYWPISKTGAVR